MTTRLVSPPVPVGSGDFVMPIKEDDTTVPVHSSTGSWCSTCKGPVAPSEPRDASAAVKIMVPQTEAQCASSSRVGNVVASPLSCASTWLATSPSSSVLSLSPTSVGLPTRQPAATHVASNSGAKGALPVHNAAAVDAARKGFRYRVVPPGEFEGERHFYPRVLNAQIHPTVRYFMGLSKERVVKRYTHLHPQVDGVKLMALLSSEPRFLKWAGCDLIHTTDSKGGKSMAVIETNSCPSGMKSTPLFEEMEEEGGYRALLERTFLPMLPEASLRVPGGGLAVLYDKNPMETTGYAAALANLTGEHVHLVPLLMDQVALSVGGQGSGCRARFVKGVLQILTDEGHWVNIRAALRYVTQRPWDRVPMDTLTLILNPIVGCLAGGRNKSVAAKAYARLNDSLALQQSGLQIMTPLTVCDVSWEELPSWVNRMGGVCVIKIPYSNAGQGVYTITSPHEFQAFQHAEQGNVYQRFVVQSLIANHTWSSLLPPAPLAHPTQDGQQQGGSRVLYHVGTMPDKRGDIYVSDLRLMVSASPKGFRVVGIYGRKAKKPLTDALEPGADSWAMLGTNLSVKVEDGLFSSESERLLLVDRRDYNTLGLGLDDLIEAFVQTVLAVTAIDHMCTSLMPKGVFSRARFEEVNDDPGLLHEIAASGGYAWGQGQGPEEEEEEGLEVGEHHRAFAS